MGNDIAKMSSLSIKLGVWASLIIAVMGIGYGIVMGLYFLVTRSPIPEWTNIVNFVEYTKSTSYLCFSLGQIIAFFSGILFIILLNSIHEYAQEEKKLLTRIGMCFGTIAVVLASINYFVQFTVVPQNISDGNFNGLEQFIQFNTKSFSSAIVVLGWGLFTGLASFFISPVFSKGRLEKLIKYFFILCGVFFFSNTIGYMMNYISLCLISTGLYNITLTAACISLCVLFRKQRNTC